MLSGPSGTGVDRKMSDRSDRSTKWSYRAILLLEAHVGFQRCFGHTPHQTLSINSGIWVSAAFEYGPDSEGRNDKDDKEESLRSSIFVAPGTSR